METATQTSPHHRELTKTEAAIAVAQIEDRLVRTAKAHAYYQKHLMALDCEAADFSRQRAFVEETTREKFSIPAGVHLFTDVFNGGLLPFDLKTFKPYVVAWVSGGLNHDQVLGLLWHFQEVEECDYGWIFLDQPLHFYSTGGHHEDSEKIDAEFTQIGSRSKNKKLNLKPLGFLALTTDEEEDEE